MTRIETRCARCGKPDSAYVCVTCADSANDALAVVADLITEVQTSIARLARHADRGGRRVRPDEDTTTTWSSEGALRSTALPVNLGARAAYNEAAAAVTAQARTLASERGLVLPGFNGYGYAGPPCGVITRPARGVRYPLWNPPPAVPPAGRPTAECHHASCALIRVRATEHPVARAARILAAHLNWLRYRPTADQDLAELETAANTIRRVVDAPPPLWYAGPCWEPTADGTQCDGELYAFAASGSVRCPLCDVSHPVAERRQWLLEQAVDTLAHAEMLAGALCVLDRKVTSAMIRGYAFRGRIVDHGTDASGRPLYRVGDVLTVLDDIARRKAEAA
jgi:hypothetical protein